MMSCASPRRSLWTAAASTALLLLLCASFNSVAAADVDVCALPASALYFNKNANTTRSPATAGAAANVTTSTNSSVRTKCWSDSAGVTVDAACVTACSCRHLEYETDSVNKSTQPFGVCLNNSMTFRCATESGLADCSAYALNADGSSALKNSGSSGRSQTNDDTPAVGAITTGDAKKSGLKAWMWAGIGITIVLVAGLIVFTIGWFKHRPKYGKNSSSLYERTTAMDAWKDGDSLGGEAPLSDATTAATAYSAAPEADPSIVAGVSGVDYHTYRLGASADQTPFMDNDSDLEQQRTLISSRISDDDSSIELHSPARHPQQQERRSSLTGRFGERLTGESRLSYASASSYGSEMDSFTSQLTFEDSEPRDTVLENHQAQQQYQQYQEAPYPRKRSTEF